MTQVGQTQSLGARLPGQVVLWGERWVKQGVQGGVVEVVAWGWGGEISHQIRQVFQSTHFFVSRHWPHLAQSFVSPEYLTDVVAVHPLLCQCQCHAPGVEMC